MFSEKCFSDWLINKKGYSKNTAGSILSRVKRIDAVYDLFDECAKDGYAYLLSVLEYSSQDARNGFLPDHDIPIVGNYYSGTKSLKSALKVYIEFLDDDTHFGQWIKSNSGEDTAFDEVLNSHREMGPINDLDVQAMLSSFKDEDTSKAAVSPTAKLAEKITFTGSLQAFLRYIGPFCKNYVNAITKSARTQHNGICEYCGQKAVLDSAHKDGEDRPIIIEKILEAHFKKSENYYEVDILLFEKLFKEAHMPVENHIFFLCKKCHTEYDRGSKISTADILAKRKN